MHKCNWKILNYDVMRQEEAIRRNQAVIDDIIEEEAIYCDSCSFPEEEIELEPHNIDKPWTEDNWQHRSENMRCRTCMYFVHKKANIGRCRCNAPSLGGWPVVYSSDWCGDHKLDENKI